MAITEYLLSGSYRHYNLVETPTEPIKWLSEACSSLLKPNWSAGQISMTEGGATNLVFRFEDPTRTELRMPTNIYLEDNRDCLSAKATESPVQLICGDYLWRIISENIEAEFKKAVDETPYQYLSGSMGFNYSGRHPEVYQLGAIIFDLAFIDTRLKMEDITDKMSLLTARMLELSAQRDQLAPIAHRTTPLLPV